MADLFFYAVCGILTGADDPKAWSNIAPVWMIQHGFCKAGNAAGFTYFDSVFGGPAHDDEQADLIAIDFSDATDEGLDIVCGCHSNGAKIILAMLTRHPKLRIKTLHMIAAAADADCEKNGLNAAVARGQIGRVIFYVSPIDEALGIGALLGYGTLGKTGPRNMSDMLKAIVGIVEEPMKHSEWVGEKFEQTMAQIVAVG